ncbi:hypothetical protein F5I97DRAFT_1079215 [Phlebopus sp. FC_14]|nr:hypothetical protein F5I97DRAFT_1079215 [Phlebopus sp. FC_14]
MAFNQFQPTQQPQTQPFKQSPYPSSASTTTRTVSAPGQSYDPRWYQRPQQQPGFVYTGQQTSQRVQYPHQHAEQPPQSQPLRQIAPPQPQQRGFQLAHSPPAVHQAHHSFPHTPASITQCSPLTSSFAPPISYASAKQPQMFPLSSAAPGPTNGSRRPLPTPKARPESFPLHSHQSPQIQAPAPSRPAILTHSASLASAGSPSSMSSPSSSSSNGSRRPLPTPLPRSTKHASLDLRVRPSSPVKTSIAEQLLPSSLTRRPTLSSSRQNQPIPEGREDPKPAPSKSVNYSMHEQPEASSPPTKFVPLWKRNLASSPSPAPASCSSGVDNMRERNVVVNPDLVDKWLDHAQTSPSRRPLPSSPQTCVTSMVNVRGRSGHMRVAASSGTDEEISSPSDPSTDEGEYEPIVFADPMGERTPSPQYGIRDLPQRSRTMIANRGNISNDHIPGRRPIHKTPSPPKQPQSRTRPTRSATLPQPPVSGQPHNSPAPFSSNTSSVVAGNGGRSLTFRLASIALTEERRNQSPERALTSPTPPPPPSSGWPTNLAPLPRTPTSQPSPPVSHVMVFSSGEKSAQPVPHLRGNQHASSPKSQPTSAPATSTGISPSPRPTVMASRDFARSDSPQKDLHQTPFQKVTDRQKEKRREIFNLDDAPPPSLRRSPSPARLGSDVIPSIQISGSPPQRHWTPKVSNRTQEPAESPPRTSRHPEHADIPSISFSNDDSDGPASALSNTTLMTVAPRMSVAPAEPPSVSFSVPSPPRTSGSEYGQGQNSAFNGEPSAHAQEGKYGTRHTQVLERNGGKRTLPALPPRSGGLSCGGCGGSIIGRIVSAMGLRWHPGCFRCTVCNELLEHVSSYEHDGRPYCHLDYHETFAPRCFHCKTSIIDERFITLDDPALGKRTYHEQHFFCAECGDPFLAPSGSTSRMGELSVTGDGDFEDDDVGFTVYKGHPYCEACHVRLRMPKCKQCKRSIRDGMRAVEALGGKWCWECFVCSSCEKPFEDPSFFLRDNKPFCERCFSFILRNEV